LTHEIASLFTDIVRPQKEPALLESTVARRSRVRIFPIEPHSRKKVALAYPEFAKWTAWLATYLYPLNRRNFSAPPLETVHARDDQQDAPNKKK